MQYVSEWCLALLLRGARCGLIDASVGESLGD